MSQWGAGHQSSEPFTGRPDPKRVKGKRKLGGAHTCSAFRTRSRAPTYSERITRSFTRDQFVYRLPGPLPGMLRTASLTRDQLVYCLTGPLPGAHVQHAQLPVAVRQEVRRLGRQVVPPCWH